MKRTLLPIFCLLLAACASQAPAPPPTGPGLEHLRERGDVQTSPLACVTAEANPLAPPRDAEALAFAEGVWLVDSRRDPAAFGGEGGSERIRAVASIQPVLRGAGLVEYYTGAWDGQLMLGTSFWGAAGGLNRWVVVETNTASGALSSLRGRFQPGEGFSMQGELFGRRAELRLSDIEADSFEWSLSFAGDDDPAWTRRYTRLENLAAANDALGRLIADNAPLDEVAGMQPFSFWPGEWDWIEHHLDVVDCAGGQAQVQWTNGGQAIEELVISSYLPEEAGQDVYNDYSLTVWNAESGEFENFWWTTGLSAPLFSSGVCEVVDGQKNCYLRARFSPSEDEDYIEWETDGILIEWFRK
jgi:hypothetical protein